MCLPSSAIGFETKTELPSGPACNLGTKMAFRVADSTDGVTTDAITSTIDLGEYSE